MRKKDNTITIKAVPKGRVEEAAREMKSVHQEGMAVIATGTSNMPDWARPDSTAIWQGADQSERKTGPAAQAITLALPEGLTVEQGEKLVNRFVREEVGPKSCEFSMLAKSGSTEPSSAKVLVSPRLHDGIARDREHFYRRYRKALPAFSGAQKDGAGRVRGKISDPELTRLQNWHHMRDEAAVPPVKPAKKSRVGGKG